MSRATADIVDEHRERALVCELQLRSFGGLVAFSGPIATVRCDEDNVLLRQQVADAGEGRVLVVDGGGSLRCALVGDRVARHALDSGWAGLVIHGCVRDVEALARLRLGIHALGTNPRPSRKLGGGEVDVPVSFGGVEFSPGATLYADSDGIVVVP